MKPIDLDGILVKRERDELVITNKPIGYTRTRRVKLSALGIPAWLLKLISIFDKE